MNFEFNRAIVVIIEMIVERCKSIEDLVFVAKTTTDACGDQTYGASLHTGTAFRELLAAACRGLLGCACSSPSPPHAHTHARWQHLFTRLMHCLVPHASAPHTRTHSRMRAKHRRVTRIVRVCIL